MTYVFSKKSTANTLALHFFDEVDWKGAFSFAEKWLCDNEFEPNRIGGKGRSNITFQRGKQSLIKEDFTWLEGKGLWMASLPPEDQIRTEMFDYKACIHIYNYHHNPKRSEIGVSWDDTLLAWNEDIFLSLVKNIYTLVKPKYGYAFQRPFSKGPGIYMAGAITGLKYEDLEKKEITRWRVLGRTDDPDNKPHFIRDVYPLNFLSPQHLEGPVGGQTLRQWIESDPTRGTLAPVVGDLTAWTVDPAHIPALREELRPHNILICFMDY